MAIENPLTEPTTAGAFRRVLVGFDGSAEAQNALRIALALAADLRGEARVLLVVRPPAHAETPEEGARAAEAERENLSRGLADIGAAIPRSLNVSSDVLYADDPAKTLATYAAEYGFDIVVVGGHGREQMTHRGIGRSVEALLRHHPCPILVV